MLKLPYKWHVRGAVYMDADAAYLQIVHDRGERVTLRAPYDLWLGVAGDDAADDAVKLAAITDLYRRAAGRGIDWRDIPIPDDMQQAAAARPLRWQTYGADSSADPRRGALCASLVGWTPKHGGPVAEIMYPDDLPKDADGYVDDDAIAAWDAAHDDDLRSLLLIACIRRGIHPLRLRPLIDASCLGSYPYGYVPDRLDY